LGRIGPYGFSTSRQLCQRASARPRGIDYVRGNVDRRTPGRNTHRLLRIAERLAMLSYLVLYGGDAFALLRAGCHAGAIGATTELMQLIADRVYEQVGTFNGTPLTMAAARAKAPMAIGSMSCGPLLLTLLTAGVTG
jgi:hypothetical protein